MPLLEFSDFINCFRKQFVFQIGHGGKRLSKYYVDMNHERGLKNDQWGLMVFIYTGSLYGFSDDEMRRELNISSSLYFFLKEEILNVISPNYDDKLLQKNVITKIGLVKNVIHHKHGIKLNCQKVVIDCEEVDILFLYKNQLISCTSNQLLKACENIK